MTFSKLHISLAFLLLLSSGIYAQANFNESFSNTNATFGGEIARNWHLMAVLALMTSIILVAIAYAVGNGFEIAELKAWASNEAVQIVANALIVAVLAVFLIFLDTALMGIVNSSNVGTPCTIGQSCLQNASTAYLDQYITGARSGAENVLRDNVVSAEWANRRYGAQALTIFALQFGITSTVVGNFMLDQDMHAISFEYYTNILSSLETQKFFVQSVAFGIGPIILALGIVGRSFFFSRKVGGLLIAIAAGMMFFFPMMYIFDWVTLDTAIKGDKGFADGEPNSCPLECSKSPPMALYDNRSSGGGYVPLTSPRDIYNLFTETDQGTARGIINGSIETAPASLGADNLGKPILSCYFGESGECPTECRELPYPSSIPSCNNQSANIPRKCAALRPECKVIRQIDTTSRSFNLAEYNSCPTSCKITPPLRSDCNVGRCLDSRYDCRVTYRNDTSYRPSVSSGANAARCPLAYDCPADANNASNSCVWVLPPTGQCDTICGACPSICRVDGADLSNLPAICKDSGGSLIAACQNTMCPDSCKVSVNTINRLLPADSTSCSSCPAEKRIISYGSEVPEDYISGSCSITNCPTEYRASIPRNSCEMCVFSEESYTYSPPVQLSCSELCKPSDQAPVRGAGEFTKIGADGLVGKAELVNVAVLLVPAYVLPLFNIVATIIFIKGLSAMLGGDIEIPGLSKVF